jgi:hypothetical protein
MEVNVAACNTASRSAVRQRAAGGAAPPRHLARPPRLAPALVVSGPAPHPRHAPAAALAASRAGASARAPRGRDRRSQSVATLEREVGRHWRAQRYAVLWTGGRALSSYRYPVPLPLPRQMWSLERAGEAWAISLRLVDRRVRLRLRGGAHFRRQQRLVDRIAAGELTAGAAYLYQRVAHEGDHRSGTNREARLMVRCSVELPVVGDPGRSGTITVCTASDALWHAVLAGEERIWTLHEQQLLRAIRRAERQHQALADDLKAERRRPRRNRAGATGRCHGRGSGRWSRRSAWRMGWHFGRAARWGRRTRGRSSRRKRRRDSEMDGHRRAEARVQGPRFGRRSRNAVQAGAISGLSPAAAPALDSPSRCCGALVYRV